jgi:hypothetical protein
MCKIVFSRLTQVLPKRAIGPSCWKWKHIESGLKRSKGLWAKHQPYPIQWVTKWEGQFPLDCHEQVIIKHLLLLCGYSSQSFLISSNETSLIYSFKGMMENCSQDLRWVLWLRRPNPEIWEQEKDRKCRKPLLLSLLLWSKAFLLKCLLCFSFRTDFWEWGHDPNGRTPV